ncbi:MAG: TetR/AcrR family transcriptional regulator [Chitinophagaceae bacterium]
MMVKQESTEEKITAAAKKVFITKGMMGARMQDIADEAGINKAMLHYYFRNKEKLFEKIFTEAFTSFWPQINNILDADMPLFSKIESFCHSYIEVLLNNPYVPIFVLNELNRQPAMFIQKVWKSGPPKVGSLIQQIEIDVKKGKIKAINPVQLLLNMVSMCVFPFVAKPMFQAALGMNELQYRQLMEIRKVEITRFIIDSISK